MKVLAFNGSPRKDGNTAILIETIFAELRPQGIQTEWVQLSDKPIHGCIACEKCIQNRDKRCAVQTDAANEYIERMLGADAVILGSPSYFQNVTAEMKALIDRSGNVARANGRMFKDKIGAAVSAQRRTGAVHVIDAIGRFLMGNQFVIAGRAVGVGRDRGDVEKDREGMEMAKSLGRRMAWLLAKIRG
jgi:multimeric flavodoxin WrbA